MLKKIQKFSLNKKLSIVILLTFLFIFIVSNIIIDLAYYSYYETMMADKLNQSVSVASRSHFQSFFYSMKKEALGMITESPLKEYLKGSAEAKSAEEFLRYRIDVSVSQYMEIYSTSRDETLYYDEISDLFGVKKGRFDIEFGENDIVFLPVDISTKFDQEQTGTQSRRYTVMYMKIDKDGSYIATGLSAHVTRNDILSGLVLPQSISYQDIKNGKAKNTGSNIYAVNSQGTILADYFQQSAGQTIEQFDFYQDFSTCEFNKPFEIFDFNQPSYIMSCSNQPRPGEIFVIGVIQKKDIIAAVTPTLLLLAVLTFFALSCFCMLCILIIRRAFSPYDQLVQRVSINSTSSLKGAELLGEAIDKGAAAKRRANEMVLIDYILDREVDLYTVSEIEKQYPGEYSIIACKIDEYDCISSDTLKHCRMVIENSLDSIGDILWPPADKNKLLFILCCKAMERNITDALKKCQSILRDSGISTSYIVGEEQSQLMNINVSYYAIQKVMFMWVCYGSESIVTNKMQEDPVEIPTNGISKLIEDINVGNKESIDSHLEQIFESFQGKTNFLIPIYLQQLTLSIISHISPFDSHTNVFDYQNVIDRVTEASSLAAAKKIISQLCYDACNYLATMQSKATERQDLVLKILEYLKANYQNPNLSIITVSDIYCYSPRYLGRIFKNFTSKPFTQCLMEIRMERAKELIIDTNLPINDIFEKVGITSSQQFYRQFKKQFGCSPTTMRKNIRNAMTDQ